MTTDTEALRAQFEREFSNNPPFECDFSVHTAASAWAGKYVRMTTQFAWEGYQAGHAAGAEHHTGLLDLVARIRAAAGDPDGRLMQDGLIERIAWLRAAGEAPDVGEPVAHIIEWPASSGLGTSANLGPPKPRPGATCTPLYTAAQLAAAVAAERERCVGIIETHRIPVGNSPAGEIACDMTYDALQQIREAIRAGDEMEDEE